MGRIMSEWEYETTTGPRKAWAAEDVPPPGEGWERDTSRGNNGWERFDHHEESYWRRRRPITWGMIHSDEGLKSAYRRAAVDFLNERRAGRDGECFLACANAIQDAYPDLVKDYEREIGVNAAPSEPGAA